MLLLKQINEDIDMEPQRQQDNGNPQLPGGAIYSPGSGAGSIKTQIDINKADPVGDGMIAPVTTLGSPNLGHPPQEPPRTPEQQRIYNQSTEDMNNPNIDKRKQYEEEQLILQRQQEQQLSPEQALQLDRERWQQQQQAPAEPTFVPKTPTSLGGKLNNWFNSLGQ